MKSLYVSWSIMVILLFDLLISVLHLILSSVAHKDRIINTIRGTHNKTETKTHTSQGESDACAVKSCISERLNLLNKFIAASITPNISHDDAVRSLREMMADKKYFIDSTKISFTHEYPEFVAFLEKSGLTDYEIGYCCLYIMGLNGKDISSYMGSGHYKLSSNIRKKFGLTERDTNLDKYLRGVFTQIL